MEHMHGKPVEKDGKIILPCYHPAFALRDTSKMRQVSDDFKVLRGLAKGRDWREYHIVDEYPDPKYVVVDTPDKVKMMEYLINQAGEFAVDTEICRGKLWSVQISCAEGEAYFIPIKDDHQGRVDLSHLKATAIVHNYLFDIQYLKLSEDDFLDTMVLSYLTGQPQGLKELANRLCGIQMVNYNEIVRPGQQKLSLEYLLKASGMEWPDPPTIEETKWDNNKGYLVTKNKKPWHISRKITKMLDDYTKDDNTDLWDRWRSIPEEERTVVESVIGVMPESSLADIPFDDAIRYSSRDSDATLRVYHRLKKMITDLDLDFVLDMDLKILPMVDAMMQNGMAVDIDHFRKLSEDYDIRMRVMSEAMAGAVGHPFNPNSSDQVATVIYKELGFKPTKTTPTGKVSTDDAELKKTGHPVAMDIIRYRGIQKLKSTYADNIVRSAHTDEGGVPRMHTVLKTTRVATGRLSSSKDDNGEGANLQNIPTRNKESKAIKNGFIAPDGKLLSEGDLGQIEIVTQTHLSRCKGLIELFNRGGDPHTETASRLFGVPLDQAAQTKYRYPCKRAGFGIIYMIGAHGLSTQINEYIADLAMEGDPIDIEPWDETTCQKFIDDYYRLYPEIREYQMEQLAQARRYGYVKDMFGRIRYIPEVSCPIQSIQEAGYRMAANFPVTASAQGVIKLAMGRLWEYLPKTQWANKVRFLMQIHDSLIVEIDDQEDIYKSYLSWMKEVMCGVVNLLVPVKVDFKIGKRWGSLDKVSL
jgi:DNA polymerase I-like protein with 3'-5' exonuclease and polymerase domains